MPNQILTNALLVLPDRTVSGSVVLENGRIADVAPGRHYADGLDLDGQLLSPGVIDIHTDYLEKEMNPRPDTNFPLELAFHMMDLRAVGCGVTTVLGAARISSDSGGPLGSWTGDGITLIERYAELRKSALGRHLIHVRWDPNFEPCEDRLERVHALRPLIGNLVYNDSTPGERQYRNTFADQVRRYAVAKSLSMEEAQSIFAERVRRAKAVNNRPIVQQLISHLLPLGSHDDTTVEHVREAHHFGSTMAEMPVTMEAAREARRLGMQICMGAPNYYRGGSHCGNLSCHEALAAGLVDILCSDYHFPSLLGSAVRMMHAGMAPHEALRPITRNPAAHLGLDGELGTMEPGKKADLVAFEAQDSFAFVTNVWVEGMRKFAVSDDPGHSFRPTHQADAVSA